MNLFKLAKTHPTVAAQLVLALDKHAADLVPTLVQPFTSWGEGEFGLALPEVVAWLKQALQLEYESWLTYFTMGNIIRGLYRDNIAEMFFEHATEEQGHMKQLLMWLTVLGFPPAPQLTVGDIPLTISVSRMLAILYDQEQQAIAWYKRGIDEVAGKKEGFRQMLETIIQTEQEHANELLMLIQAVSIQQLDTGHPNDKEALP